MTLPADTDPAASPSVEAIPLGGLGEFGLNTMLVVWGDTGILIDAGAMFPGPELPGVDLIVPDYRCLKERVGTLAAIGFGGNRLAVPPKGAVNRPPPFRIRSPIQPCSVAMGG